MHRSSFIAAAAGAGAALAAGATRVAAQAPAANVRVIFFGVAGNLPVWAGMSKGFFARENLNVTATVTPGSVYMMQHLNAGDFDVAHTSIDNCVAYDEGAGEVALTPPGDFAAFMGGDTGLLSVWARPEIKMWTDLVGKTLAVDAVTTGFAFVLQDMLMLNAVNEKEYRLAPAGGTPKRYQALVESDKYAAGVLTPPFDLLAESHGLRRLGNASEWIAHYQAYAGVARRSWLAQNHDVAVRYIRAYLAAIEWIYHPNNKTEAIALLVEHAHVPPAIAPQAFAEITGPGGIARDAKIDMAGLREVIDLRKIFGKPEKPLGGPEKYVDTSAYDAAIAKT